ncbi:MAG: endonuclease/exonuclease/phosphatase family protein [Verrucomicrobia bacterium]|nr:MAG: endonuclease/exonuclease/phosphatase family protein [Verrucomicrobiota bacterium]
MIAMRHRTGRRLLQTCLVALVLGALGLLAGERFSVATYNVENYLDAPASGRVVKPEASRAKVAAMILQARPDIIALQEMGRESALLELRDRLRRAGLDYPYYEHAGGWDTNIFVAVLSRFPIVERRSHTDDSYLVGGRRLHLSRAIIEVDIAVNDHYRLTLFTAHLKSRRQVPYADQAAMRLEEARLLREKVDALLRRNPEANVIVTGDFNDTKDSPSTRAVVGQGRFKLIDTRPAEPNGDNLPAPRPDWDPRNITWTHFYGKEDSYERIDYLLISPGLAREWVKERTFVITAANWGLASDHRPILATFEATDR